MQHGDQPTDCCWAGPVTGFKASLSTHISVWRGPGRKLAVRPGSAQSGSQRPAERGQMRLGKRARLSRHVLYTSYHPAIRALRLRAYAHSAQSIVQHGRITLLRDRACRRTYAVSCLEVCRYAHFQVRSMARRRKVQSPAPAKHDLLIC